MSTLTARNRLAGLGLAALIYGIDQWLKKMVAGAWGLREQGDHLDLSTYFDLTRTHNYGVSLGFLTADSMEMRWGLVALTGAIALIVLVWLLREKRWGEILPLALVLGGACGNIQDRYRLGFVLDYADLHFGEFRPFLIFNLADAAITVGVVIILARSFLIREKADNKPAGEPVTETNNA